MKKYVLILGTQDDYQSKYMENKLREMGVTPVLLDSRIFPDKIKLTYDVDCPTDGYFILDGSKEKIQLSNILGAYYRVVKGVVVPQEKDRLLQHVVMWNNEAFFESFIEILSCRWVNSPIAVSMHHKKPLHLQMLKKSGILVPETCITNDCHVAMQILENSDRQFIFKPVRGWANTEILTKDMLKGAEPLLKKSPITLQEYIKGEDYRVYVINDEVMAIKIISDDVDSRKNVNNEHIRTEIPDDVAEMCRKTAKILNLSFTAIDIKKSEDDKYYILEANATPIFINDEIASKFPIGEKICNYLING